MRNEIARMNGQTRWQCQCGGTDCEGRRENAELRADKERLDIIQTEAKKRLIVITAQPKVGLMDHDEFRVHLNGIGVVGTFDTIRAAIDAARAALEAKP